MLCYGRIKLVFLLTYKIRYNSMHNASLITVTLFMRAKTSEIFYCFRHNVCSKHHSHSSNFCLPDLYIEINLRIFYFFCRNCYRSFILKECVKNCHSFVNLIFEYFYESDIPCLFPSLPLLPLPLSSTFHQHVVVTTYLLPKQALSNLL